MVNSANALGLMSEFKGGRKGRRKGVASLIKCKMNGHIDSSRMNGTTRCEDG